MSWWNLISLRIFVNIFPSNNNLLYSGGSKLWIKTTEKMIIWCKLSAYMLIKFKLSNFIVTVVLDIHRYVIKHNVYRFFLSDSIFLRGQYVHLFWQFWWLTTCYNAVKMYVFRNNLNWVELNQVFISCVLFKDNEQLVNPTWEQGNLLT